MEKAYLPSVSVVVPAYNEEAVIGRVLEALLAQQYPSDKYEIVVVDDGSTDRTYDIARQYPVKVIRSEVNKGLAAALNLGIKNSRGEIVVVVSADCVPTDHNFIINLVQPFKDPQVGATVGYWIAEGMRNRWGKIFRFIYPIGDDLTDLEEKIAPGETGFVSIKCDGYRRSVLKEIGFFDEFFSRFSACEDNDISFRIRRAGYKIIRVPQAKVFHILSTHQQSLAGHLKKAVKYALPQHVTLMRWGWSFRYENLLCALTMLWTALLLPLYLLSRSLGLLIGYAALAALISVLVSLVKDKTSFEGVTKKRVISTFLLVAMISLLLILTDASIYLPVILPFITGLSYFLIVSISNARRCFKKSGKFVDAVYVFALSLLWNIIYGLAFFLGIVSIQADIDFKKI